MIELYKSLFGINSNTAIGRKNKRLIGCVFSGDKISRNDLVKHLEWSQASVSDLVNSLIKREILIEKDPEITNRGRAPVPLSVFGKRCYGAGIFFYSSKINVIEAVILDASRQIVGKRRVSCPSPYPKQKLATAMSLLDELIKTSNIDIKKLVGIGLACPGIVTPQSGKVKTASIFRGERNLDLISPFQKRFNVPCCVYNNSSLFAMLEKIRGFGKEMNSFLFMHSISGLSMFLNNLVYEGHQGCGGELGFLQIDPRGPVGADGRKGIIASVRPFNKASRTIQKIIEAGAQNTIMTKYWNREKEPILFFEPVKKAAIEGDILSRYYIKEAFETIAEVVVGLIYLFNPEAFFLPSWTAECEDITIQVVRDKAALCKLMNDELDVKIQAGYTCDELIAEGAALQMLLNFFEVNTYLR